MKIKILSVLLILSLGINAGVIGTIGFHWIHHRVGQKDDSGFVKHMQRKLGLSAEQAAILGKGRMELQACIQPARTTIQNKRMELLSLLEKENAYSPATDALIGDIAQLQMEIERNVIHHSFDTKKILTPAQQNKLYALLRKGMKRGGKHPTFMHDKMY
jgi:Spy/CpxP family protein refolding chaperone